MWPENSTVGIDDSKQKNRLQTILVVQVKQILARIIQILKQIIKIIIIVLGFE